MWNTTSELKKLNEIRDYIPSCLQAYNLKNKKEYDVNKNTSAVLTGSVSLFSNPNCDSGSLIFFS